MHTSSCLKNIFRLCFTVTLLSCNNRPSKQADISTLSWPAILEQAKGQTVQMMMWQGDPLINKYMTGFITPLVKEKYGIDLKITAGQGNSIVSVVMNENEAGKEKGDVDICWINGETFYQLRQVDGLYGPFVNRLPNAAYIDFDNPFIKYDFQKPIEGMECPWGNVQLCLIYNSEKIDAAPKNRTELEAFVKKYPGKFTMGTDFTGLTFLKSLLIDMAGGQETLKGDFDTVKYRQYAPQLWAYINRIKPWFWKEGKTFPASVAVMHQLFSQGELYMTMSNNDGEVDNKVAQGIFPKFARGYVLDGGTIQNTHYLGILKNSANKMAAMAVINCMISPEAQLEKQRSAVWGDGTVLEVAKLPLPFRNKFDSLQQRSYGPMRTTIQPRALMELDPEYMIRLNDDFRKYVIEQ